MPITNNMRSLPTLVIFVALLAAGAAQGQFVNRIGVYGSPTPDSPMGDIQNPDTNVHTPGPGFLDLYLVCVNPYNAVRGAPIAMLGGYELSIRIDLAWALHSVTLPPDILDLDGATDALYCSGMVPVSDHGDNRIALLGTIRLWHTEPQPGIGVVFVDPYFVAPSIPDHMAVTDALDNFSLHRADPSAWSEDMPVCYINYFWDPAEDLSWGDVKALYR